MDLFDSCPGCLILQVSGSPKILLQIKLPDFLDVCKSIYSHDSQSVSTLMHMKGRVWNIEGAYFFTEGPYVTVKHL